MKKIFGFAAVVAMVAVANVKMASNNNEGLTALQLENIEYLAEAENTTTYKWVHYNPAGNCCGCLDPGSLTCTPGNSNF